MSEEGGASPAAADEPTPGELLQRQRERSGLTLERAAQDLHLDTWVIEAIETNHFSALGAPVFAKGHLRKYAAMLGVPAEEVLRRYERIADGPETPTLIPAAHGTVPESVAGVSRWALIVLAVGIVGALVAWWLLAPDAARRDADDRERPVGTAPRTPTPQEIAPGSADLDRRPGVATPLPEAIQDTVQDRDAGPANAAEPAPADGVADAADPAE